MEKQIEQSEQKLKNSFDLLKNAFEIYKKDFALFVGIMLIPVLLNIVLTVTQLNSAQQQNNFSDSYGTIRSIVTVIVGILSILCSAWAYLAIVISIKNKGEGVSKSPTIYQSYLNSKNKLPSYILINILVAIATIPGIVFLGIPAIIYAVWFSFSSLVLVFESHRGLKALMRSREYVVHRWWKTAWRIAFIIVLLLAIQYLFSLITTTINYFIGLIETSQLATVPTILKIIITAGISGLGTLITVPLSISYSYLLYLNLKETRPELATQPVNEKYKWLYILSPTTVLILIILFIGVLVTVARLGA